MIEYQWIIKEPTVAGWYWFRRMGQEADHFVVQVDEVDKLP